MSRISILLENILKAVYGKDVRQSIHDAIEQCYTDVSSAKTLADDSVTLMQENIEDCNASASACDTAVDELPDQVTGVFADLGITKSNGKLCVEVERE